MAPLIPRWYHDGVMKPHVCPWWFAYSFDNPLRRLLHPPEKILSSWVRPGMTVLDMGCGIGHFTLGMARMVGPGGRVFAADLQERALAVVGRRASRAGLADRITTLRCSADSCGVAGPVGFALAFWMLHETPAAEAFCRRIAGALSPGGRFLVAEPAFHVGAAAFDAELTAAARAGLTVIEQPKVRGSRAALFGRRDGIRSPAAGFAPSIGRGASLDQRCAIRHSCPVFEPSGAGSGRNPGETGT